MKIFFVQYEQSGDIFPSKLPLKMVRKVLRNGLDNPSSAVKFIFQPMQQE